MLVPAFLDAYQSLTVKTGKLSRDETEQGGEMATVSELRAVAHCGDNCRSGLCVATISPSRVRASDGLVGKSGASPLQLIGESLYARRAPGRAQIGARS
jgi:hypothetical protein